MALKYNVVFEPNCGHQGPLKPDMAHIYSCRFVIDIQLSAIFFAVVNKLMVVLPFREHIIMMYIDYIKILNT